MRIKMVSLLVFSDGVSVPFPHFDVKRADDMIADEYVTAVKERTHDILCEMSNKEYLAQRAIGGTMPCLNHVFEELGMHHREQTVPLKVLKSFDKTKKAIAKNTTTVAEAKKRKGAIISKMISKRQRTSAACATTFTSFGEEVVENVGGGFASAAASMEGEHSTISADLGVMTSS
jgi:hypothetical protein